MSDNLSDAENAYDQALLEEIAKIKHSHSATLTCDCGTVWRSPNRYSGRLTCIVSKIPCPKCGRQDRIKRATGDPESWKVR